jgi:Zn-dependent peptidase ImmA (M78 family)
MKKMTTKPPRRQTWLKALAEVAKVQGVHLPSFTVHGMGGARSASVEGGRFVTFKRRLVPPEQAKVDGVEWTLWRDQDDSPVPVAAFREPVEPNQQFLGTTFTLLKGWLVDKWTSDEAKAAVERHPRRHPIADVAVPNAEKREYWLSEDQSFGFIVTKDRWSLYNRGHCLTSWRFKDDGASADYLELRMLDCLCSWIAKQWPVIAFGSDYRPSPLSGFPVAASRAYENAELARTSEKDSAVQAWWSRHAVRAVEGELPNIFFERQGDEIVISWDASPSPNRFYQVLAGEETFGVALAVPTLRRLVADRLKPKQLGAARQELEGVMSIGAAAGYSAMMQYNSAISDVWLAQHGFSDKDAQELAASGTSRHLLVGLLRSSQGSSLVPADYEKLLDLLKPGNAQHFVKLRELAKGANPAINPREPWESGYQLARLIRTRLELQPFEYLDIERVVREIGTVIHEIEFSDRLVLGVCLGTPGYVPLVVFNSSCDDVSGMSGRRVTLAHELCHLLFDRARLRSLARFERGEMDSDRLLEMRANAFAVELLVPMSTLVDDNGLVADDSRLAEIAEKQGVSSHALQWHARNLRNRLAER